MVYHESNLCELRKVNFHQILASTPDIISFRIEKSFKLRPTEQNVYGDLGYKCKMLLQNADG